MITKQGHVFVSNQLIPLVPHPEHRSENKYVTCGEFLEASNELVQCKKALA